MDDPRRTETNYKLNWFVGRRNRETENREVSEGEGWQPAGVPMGLGGRMSLGAVHRAEGAQRMKSDQRRGEMSIWAPEMSEHMLGGRTLWEAKQSYAELAGRKFSKGLQETKAHSVGYL